MKIQNLNGGVTGKRGSCDDRETTLAAHLIDGRAENTELVVINVGGKGWAAFGPTRLRHHAIRIAFPEENRLWGDNFIENFICFPKQIEICWKNVFFETACGPFRWS